MALGLPETDTDHKIVLPTWCHNNGHQTGLINVGIDDPNKITADAANNIAVPQHLPKTSKNEILEIRAKLQLTSRELFWA